MSRRLKRCHGLGALLAALAPLCLAAPPAEAQLLGSLASFVGEKVEDLERFVSGPPRPRAPEGVRACEGLYGSEAKDIARDRELFRSYQGWLDASYDRIRDLGPVPICFPFAREVLTTRLSQRLLELNNHYLRQHRGPYVLTGYTDRAESDLGLAQRRAEEIQNHSPLPTCRYRVARQRGGSVLQYRKVHYTRDAAGGVRPCPR